MNSKSATVTETFADIPKNRTLFLENFTVDLMAKPKVVHGLQTLQQLFDHFQPSVSIGLEPADGAVKTEVLRFNSIDSFGIETIVNRSPVLKDLVERKAGYLHVLKELKTNKELREVLADAALRKKLGEVLEAMQSVLQANK